MARFLIDTSVISETIKNSPDTSVTAWFAALGDFSLSPVSVFEIASGIERLPPGVKRERLDAWFATLTDGSIEFLDFDRPVALAASRIEARAHKEGHPIDFRDLIILSSAWVHDLAIATRNVSHFQGHEVRVFNPFTGLWAR